MRGGGHDPRLGQQPDASPSRASVAGRGRGVAAGRGARRRVEDVALTIFEPPRFFEALLRGRASRRGAGHHRPHLRDLPGGLPDERLRAPWRTPSGVRVDDQVTALRRLLYCGEWIQSHALHVYLLARPRLPRLRRRRRAGRAGPRVRSQRGLALKQTGNLVMETVGGRAVHPVNVRVGGFYRAPRTDDVAALAEPLERARGRRPGHRRLGRRASTSPTWTADYRFVALRGADGYPMESGRVASSDGLDVTPAGFADRVVEEHVARSTALHARLDGRARVPDRPAGPLRAERRRAARGRPSGRGRGRARGGRAPTRSGASWCGPSSWSPPATRRCGWSTPTSRPTRRPQPVGAAGGRWAPEPRRHRVGSCSTATSSTPMGLITAGPDRAAHVPEPAHHRVRPPAGRPGGPGPPRRPARPGGASRRCGTTTPASRAPPTSST